MNKEVHHHHHPKNELCKIINNILEPESVGRVMFAASSGCSERRGREDAAIRGEQLQVILKRYWNVVKWCVCLHKHDTSNITVIVGKLNLKPTSISFVSLD